MSHHEPQPSSHSDGTKAASGHRRSKGKVSVGQNKDTDPHHSHPQHRDRERERAQELKQGHGKGFDPRRSADFVRTSASAAGKGRGMIIRFIFTIHYS